MTFDEMAQVYLEGYIMGMMSVLDIGAVTVEDVARLTGRDLRKVGRALGGLLSRRQIQYDPAAGQYIFFVSDSMERADFSKVFKERKVKGMDNQEKEVLLGYLQMKGAIEALLWLHVHGPMHLSAFSNCGQVLGAGIMDGFLHVDNDGMVELTQRGTPIAARLMEVFA